MSHGRQVLQRAHLAPDDPVATELLTALELEDSTICTVAAELAQSEAMVVLHQNRAARLREALRVLGVAVNESGHWVQDDDL